MDNEEDEFAEDMDSDPDVMDDVAELLAVAC